MEVISVLLGYDQIHTNIKFVHVPTVPLEDRPGMQRVPPLRTLECLNILPRNRVQTLADIDVAQAIPACAIKWTLSTMATDIILRRNDIEGSAFFSCYN
jgi:hypothetical protein